MSSVTSVLYVACCVQHFTSVNVDNCEIALCALLPFVTGNISPLGAVTSSNLFFLNISTMKYAQDNMLSKETSAG